MTAREGLCRPVWRFPPSGGKQIRTRNKAEVWAAGRDLFASVLRCGIVFSRVECQAGERVGAVNGPRLSSLRPEIPTAQGFFGFDGIQNYGAVFGADAPWYGAVIADFPRVYGVFYGAAAGAKHRKEAFH